MVRTPPNLLVLLLVIGCKDKSSDSASISSEPVVTWSEAFDTSTTGSLSGVWGTGPDDVFVVGGVEAQGEIYHFDGTEWSPMTVPAGQGLLVWSYGFAPDNVYSVGVNGAMVHFDGTAWSAIETGTEQDLWGIFGTADDDLWIVGGDPDTDDCGDPDIDGEQACLWHFDGKTLTPHALAKGVNDRGATSIFKVWGIGDLLFAVGQKGLILQYDGAQWSRISGGAEANDDFVSLWGPSADEIVAVGGRGNARIATWDGSAFETTSPSGIGGLNAVFMTEADEAIVGGIYGWVGNFTPSTGELTEEGILTTVDIHAIWGDGAGRFYAVGGNFIEPHVGAAFVRTIE